MNITWPGWAYRLYGQIKLHYWSHALRRHSVAWFACGSWVTSVECYTCDKRWEDED